MAQTLRCQRRRQDTRIPNLDAISEDGDLHGSRRGVVAMGDSIDNGLADHIGRDFIADGCLIALGASANTAIEF